MSPPNFDNGWERWRGEIHSRVTGTEMDVEALLEFKQDAEKRIASMETKIVVFTAIAAGLGSVLSNWLFK